jgi:hypothetical protein
VDKERGDDISKFPIEHARSRGSIVILGFSTLVVIGWAWSFERRVHPAVPLVLQAYIGWKATVLHQFYSTLIVDIFPSKSGPAAAANNIVRCTLSAVAVAVLQPLADAIGRGWTFTLFGLLDGVVGIAMVWALRRHGKAWRDKRLQEK